MKRAYFEMIVAGLVLAWTIGNMLLTGTILTSCFPIILSFCIQFIGILAVATTPEKAPED